MQQIITGIQQVGIGVTNIKEAWTWYRKWFGTDVPVFDDVAEATLMTDYTGGDVHSRRAVLALNMAGGGGFEIWQFHSREPENCSFDITPGDLGINAVKMKCMDVIATHNHFTSSGCKNVSKLFTMPDKSRTFWVIDPYGNRFQVVRGDSWFQKIEKETGGVCGVVIGVSDIEAVLPLYRSALGFDETRYDKTGQFDDLDDHSTYRRVLMHKSQAKNGAFSRLFGHIDIELIQVLDRKPKNIYSGRYWGDPGFIHVCFDVIDMEELKKRCAKLGFPFTVDSSSTFDMGDAAGRFSYIEDPDKTLLEFVQAHKLPIIKKLGWFLSLKKRKHQKPLPNWLLKTMALNRVKD